MLYKAQWNIVQHRLPKSAWHRLRLASPEMALPSPGYLLSSPSGDSDIVWQITLLGGLRAESRFATIERFRSQKFGALLAYLALFPRRVHTREELSDLLWAEADMDSARANLRTALAFLRRELEPQGIPENSVLEKKGHTYVRLVPEAFRTDVHAFEEALVAASRPSLAVEDKVRKLQEAVSLYHGPLLPGFYDAWALGERDRLAEAYLKALYQLARHHEQSGALEAALSYARKAVASDPNNEEAHGVLLRMLMASGQFAAAQRHYETLEQRLRDEMDSAPAPELRAIVEDRSVRVKPRASAVAVPSPSAFAFAAPPAGGEGKPDRAPSAASATATSETVAPDTASSVAPVPLISLPPTLTRFFGREDELTQVQTALAGRDAVRLLTITGPGGGGKTRLAVEAACALADTFPGGVFFVSLQEIADAGRIHETIIDALHLSRLPNASPEQQVVQTLQQYEQNGRILLVLDNFEHLTEAGSGIVATLLHRVPALTCLVTSRQRLLIDGEQELPLLPLSTPDLPGKPELLMEFPSVQLFVHRARTARPDFQLTERNASAVAELCRRLDGIPLAIELAAAWSAILTPAQMLQRLGKRFELLVSRRREGPERHRTLRGAIEWSFTSLPEEVAAFFVQLSVFRGGCTLEAAEAITGEPRAVEFLSELRDRSLILVTEQAPGENSTPPFQRDSVLEEDTSAMRCRLLETLREFAAERLAQTGEGASLSERHFRHYLHLAQEADARLRGPEQVMYLRRLDAEGENLRAALEWSLSEQQPVEVATDGLRLIGFLGYYWLLRSHVRDGLEWLERALARVPDAPAEARIRALIAAGNLAWRIHDHDTTLRFCEQAVALSQEVGDTWSEAQAHITIGEALHHAGSPEASRLQLDEAVALAKANGDDWLIGSSLYALGHILSSQGDMERAQAVVEESLVYLRRQGDSYSIAHALRAKGNLVWTQRNFAEATAALEESMQRFQQIGDVGATALALVVLGYLVADTGDIRGAISHLSNALRLCREVGDSYCAAHALVNRGRFRIISNETQEGREDLMESLRLFGQIGFGGDIALSLETIAEYVFVGSYWERLMVALASADNLRHLSGVPLPGVERRLHESLIEQAQEVLGEERSQRLRQRGRALSAEQIVAYVLDAEAIKY
ncbi:MAG: hypothetical protein OHK0029_17150 [Armatimonadaceae bacterium]